MTKKRKHLILRGKYRYPRQGSNVHRQALYDPKLGGKYRYPRQESNVHYTGVSRNELSKTKIEVNIRDLNFKLLKNISKN